jgi:CRP-like cAMP-binding protein
VEWRLLAGVPEEDVREILQSARRRRFTRNEVVFHRDDPSDSVHLVAKGRFSIRVMHRAAMSPRSPFAAQATASARWS